MIHAKTNDNVHISCSHLQNTADPFFGHGVYIPWMLRRHYVGGPGRPISDPSESFDAPEIVNSSVTRWPITGNPIQPLKCPIGIKLSRLYAQSFEETRRDKSANKSSSSSSSSFVCSKFLQHIRQMMKNENTIRAKLSTCYQPIIIKIIIIIEFL